MPLHDWKDDRGWNNVHLIWLAQLLDWVQPRLPAGYRAYLGSVPTLTIDTPADRSDLSIRQWTPSGQETGRSLPAVSDIEPDQEAIATFTLDPQQALHIDLDGKLVAALELVSPRNKERPAARERYLGRYVAYLHQGIHLLLIDVLPRPVGFSFADALASNLGIVQPPCPVPCAASYRVGESVPDGTLVAQWCRPLQVGKPLPTIPLALTAKQNILMDLEYTYQETARRAYLA